MKIFNLYLPFRSTLMVFCILFWVQTSNGYGQTATAEKQDYEKILIERIENPLFGDLKQIKKRKLIRILVTFSKTNFFFDGGQARGFEYELLHTYEKYLNKNIKKKTDHIKMVFIQKPFDQLLPTLIAGKGDMAAAGLTITPERKKHVAFTNPYIPNVNEVVVMNSDVRDVNTLDDLSGKMVYVRPGSSYVEHLEQLNVKFADKGIKPIKIREGDQNLATEDILEMVNAGVLKITVADHHIAEAWTQVLPNLQVRKDLKINSGGNIAWAVRKNNPELLGDLNTFIKKNKKGSLMGNILFKRYYAKSKWIKNPTTESERRKLEKIVKLFAVYADRYGFNWLAIAAQAYQESGLDQGKKSPVGAIGIMQILPSTAADKSVNIKNIQLIENNIHAGVKYLNFLRDRYFNEPEIDPAARVNFAWAAYNAGPARINRLRKKAAESGFDPNKWFSNVEKIAAKEIGRETVDYVANINKYFIAYTLFYEAYLKRDTQRKASGVSTKAPEEMKKTKVARPPTTKKAAKTASQYHIVRSGETLYRISRKYGITVKELTRLNRINASTIIRPGDRLKVTP